MVNWEPEKIVQVCFFAIESRDLGISDSKRLRVKRRKITLQEADTSHVKNEKIEQKVSKTILQIHNVFKF